MMRNLLTLLLTIHLLIFAGCSSLQSSHESVATDQAKPQLSPSPDSKPKAAPSQAEPIKSDSAAYAQVVSLSDATSAQAATLAAERKIIRNGELTLETESPADDQRRITAIAESLGGFVVTSELKQNTTQAKTSQSVVVVARVPASQFNAALDQIRGIGSKVAEKISGQDVSEEYLDTEARIRTKKALEAQFLEIMKQAKKVSEALEVQNELANVRTEIERLEGRRRFLENQSALSTITVNLQLPAPVVATTSSGFGHDIKQAFGDAIDIAAAIILFLIRAVIVLAPLALIFGLPAWFIWRLARRRIRLNDKPASIIESQ
jgi:ribosomal protein S13